MGTKTWMESKHTRMTTDSDRSTRGKARGEHRGAKAWREASKGPVRSVLKGLGRFLEWGCPVPCPGC